MGKAVKILALGLVGFLAVACNPAGKFAILEVDEPYFDGLTSVHTRAVVKNSSGKDLTVESATLVFSYKTRLLVTARLMLPVTVHVSSTERVRIDLALEDTTLARLQTLERRAENNPDEVTVEMRAHVQFGKTRRVVELKDIPLSAIISNFEVINPTVK
jgi:hypothetical protein